MLPFSFTSQHHYHAYLYLITHVLDAGSTTTQLAPPDATQHTAVKTQLLPPCCDCAQVATFACFICAAIAPRSPLFPTKLSLEMQLRRAHNKITLHPAGTEAAVHQHHTTIGAWMCTSTCCSAMLQIIPHPAFHLSALPGSNATQLARLTAPAALSQPLRR